MRHAESDDLKYCCLRLPIIDFVIVKCGYYVHACVDSWYTDKETTLLQLNILFELRLLKYVEYLDVSIISEIQTYFCGIIQSLD